MRKSNNDIHNGKSTVHKVKTNVWTPSIVGLIKRNLTKRISSNEWKVHYIKKEGLLLAIPWFSLVPYLQMKCMQQLYSHSQQHLLISSYVVTTTSTPNKNLLVFAIAHTSTHINIHLRIKSIEYPPSVFTNTDEAI